MDQERIPIAVDVMGADRPPGELILGGLDAARALGDRIQIVLVGSPDAIEPVLDQVKDCPANVSVEAASEVVAMSTAPTDALRMKDSSIAVGLRLHKEGRVKAFVSPGNTGAVMATALLTVGRIKGVQRPAIALVMPTSSGRPTLLLDVGANADCKPQHLLQFAVMGSLYSQIVFNHEAPRVGLLSIGEERSKGNELITTAARLLEDAPVNFIGNVEGRDILSGTVDIVVTDGFTGNALLKFGESIQPFLFSAIQRQIQTNLFSRFAIMLLAPFLRRLKNRMDYRERGGAPLLGVNGNVIICHGSSNATAIANAVKIAHELVSREINRQIELKLINGTDHRLQDVDGKSTNNRDGVVRAAAATDQR